jgi:hypothetical protein
MEIENLADYGINPVVYDVLPELYDTVCIFRTQPQGGRRPLLRTQKSNTYAIQFALLNKVKKITKVSDTEWELIVGDKPVKLVDLGGGYEIIQKVADIWPLPILSRWGDKVDELEVRYQFQSIIDGYFYPVFAGLRKLGEGLYENVSIIGGEPFDEIGVEGYDLDIELVSATRLDYRKSEKVTLDGSSLIDLANGRFINLNADPNTLPNLSVGTGEIVGSYNPEMPYNQLRINFIQKTGSYASRTAFHKIVNL